MRDYNLIVFFNNNFEEDNLLFFRNGSLYYKISESLVNETTLKFSLRRLVVVLTLALTLVVIFSIPFDKTSASQACICEQFRGPYGDCFGTERCPKGTTCSVFYDPPYCVVLTCWFAGYPGEEIHCPYE